MRKWLMLSGIVVIILAGLFFWKTTQVTAQKSGVATAKAVHLTFVKTTQSSGKTKALTDVTLRFQTSGRLQWIRVKEGDSVTAYQAIAGLDAREVQKNLTKTLRDYASERNDFEDTKNLTYIGQTPDTALTDSIKHILQKNQWDLDKAVLDVELDHLAVEYATLISPINGIVIHIDTPVSGVNITPATSTFEVIDPKSMIFEVNADETDVGNLTIGQKATITLDAYPDETFSGTVSYISYASVLSAGGATVFPVRIAFDEPQNIRIGLNGDVSIDTVKIPDALVIPIEAIREDTEGKFVYTKTKDTFRRIPVKTGPQNDTQIIIKEGLTEGDEVVTKGFNTIKV